MNTEANIPEPEDSGSNGKQVKADIVEGVVDLQPVGRRTVANAITGLAATNARAFGGEIASTLIAGATAQMANELDQTRQELNDQRNKNEKLVSDLSNEKIKSAVLAERIDSYRSSRHLKNVSIAAGSLFFGTGVQLIRSGSTASGVAGVAIGSVLLIFSWASVPKGGER